MGWLILIIIIVIAVTIICKMLFNDILKEKFKINHLLTKAGKGDVDAQIEVAEYYSGVKKDKAEAMKWYHKAAEQGDAKAQVKLGICYKYGEEENCNEAVQWFCKAAEQGDAEAQVQLGICYLDGEGVDQDYVEAVKWFRKAADQGYADGQVLLGRRYEYGEGVKKNEAEAVKWYRNAAEQGDNDGKLIMADCLYYGIGVKKDQAKAIKMYEKLSDDYYDAQIRLDEIAKERKSELIASGEVWEGMTEEQLLESRGEPDDILEGERRTIYRYGKNEGPRGGIKYDIEVTIKDGEVTFIKGNR